ncbi:MAG: sulfatase [Planctomycetota bacterium]|jgi:arylsulfatase A-like enzyme
MNPYLLKLVFYCCVVVLGLISHTQSRAVDDPIKQFQQRPNVLFILTDDQRWDALGIAGHKHLKTPNIDRIGREGLYFRNAFCTTSLCSPSRASILSGLYAHKHGVTNNFTEYPTNLKSFPRVLQSSGYQTAYIGKWHMGEDNDEPRPGFDWFVTHKGQGKYFDTEFNLNGQERKVVPGYYTHVVTQMAVEWLKRPRGDQPWCLMIGHKAPHSFYYPEPKYQKAFDEVSVPYPESSSDRSLEDKPEWIRKRRSTWHGIYGPLFDWRKKFPDESPEGVRDFEAMTRAYWGTILSVDDSVGELLRLLEERGELDRTVIVYMSDNGILNGEHGMVDKRTAHEPSMRIVQLVRYPGLVSKEHGRVIDQSVLTVDLAPSILELCGSDPIDNIDGKSWKRLVQGDTEGWRTSFLYHYNYEKQFPYTPNVRCVRTDRWKYSCSPHGDRGPDRHRAELYHIAEDPLESKNLIDEPRYAEVLVQMQQELKRVMSRVGLDEQTDIMPIDEGIKESLPDQKIR